MLAWFKGLFKKSKNTTNSPVVNLPIQNNLSNFEFALEYTFADEGVLSNDKFDKGGITKYGIILDDLIRIGRKNPTSDDIKNLTRSEAKDIYKTLYWDSMSLDRVNHRGVATCLFDIGVVRGTGIPPKYVVEICGSTGAINSINPNSFIDQFSARALSGFNQIVARNPTQARFIKGWSARAKRLLTLKDTV